MASQNETWPRVVPQARLDTEGDGCRHFEAENSQHTRIVQPEPVPPSASLSQLTAGAQLELALCYARAGWPVFPVSQGKRPLTKNGFKDATTDAARLQEWWAQYPDAFVAIPTGSLTGLWVLDVDAPAGYDSLRDLLVLLGLQSVNDLSPLIVETPRGGLHIWFALRPGEHPRTRSGDIGHGLDTRGEGGYCIAPGNMRSDGQGYRRVGGQHG